MKWAVDEGDRDIVNRLLDRKYLRCAPDLIGPELANALWKKVRRAEIDASRVARRMRALDGIELDPSTPLAPHALDLALRLNRTVYDCTYLALALTLDCPLVTADRKFYATVAAGALATHILFVEDPL